MNIYKISPNWNIGWDEYDGAVVQAESKENALQLIVELQGLYGEYPSHSILHCEDSNAPTIEWIASNLSDEKKIIMTSFNAG